MSKRQRKLIGEAMNVVRWVKNLAVLEDGTAIMKFQDDPLIRFKNPQRIIKEMEREEVLVGWLFRTNMNNQWLQLMLWVDGWERPNIRVDLSDVIK